MKGLVFLLLILGIGLIVFLLNNQVDGFQAEPAIPPKVDDPATFDKYAAHILKNVSMNLDVKYLGEGEQEMARLLVNSLRKSCDVPESPTKSAASDVAKAAQTASDVAKASQVAADVAKASQTPADVAKAVEAAADVAKAAEATADIAKASQASADITKAAEAAAEIAKAAEAAAEAAKASQAAADVAKAAEAAQAAAEAAAKVAAEAAAKVAAEAEAAAQAAAEAAKAEAAKAEAAKAEAAKAEAAKAALPTIIPQPEGSIILYPQNSRDFNSPFFTKDMQVTVRSYPVGGPKPERAITLQEVCAAPGTANCGSITWPTNTSTPAKILGQRFEDYSDLMFISLDKPVDPASKVVYLIKGVEGFQNMDRVTPASMMQGFLIGTPYSSPATAQSLEFRLGQNRQTQNGWRM